MVASPEAVQIAMTVHEITTYIRPSFVSLIFGSILTVIVGMSARFLKLPTSTANYICSLAASNNSFFSSNIVRRFQTSSVEFSGHSKWSTIKHKKGTVTERSV